MGFKLEYGHLHKSRNEPQKQAPTEFSVIFSIGRSSEYSQFRKYTNGTPKSKIDADFEEYKKEIMDDSEWEFNGPCSDNAVIYDK